MATLSELSREAERALDAFSGGCSNPQALAYFRVIAARMRTVPPSRASEKIVGMLSWCAILYSARKHQSWARGDRTGVEVVSQFLRQELVVMRMIESMDHNSSN